MSAIKVYQRLRDLLDVNITSPADGEVLSYDLASSKWKNAAATGGSQSVLAIVEIALLNGWDGSALPFDVVRTDPQVLWDATNHQFVAQATGWYAVQTFPTAAGGGVSDAGGAGGSVFASVGGPGDNVGAGNAYALGGAAVFPMVNGITRLRVGDTIDIEGSGIGVLSVGELAFAIQLIST